MIKYIVLALVFAGLGEFLYRKFFPKVKAEAAVVSAVVSKDVAAVKADVVAVEAELKP